MSQFPESTRSIDFAFKWHHTSKMAASGNEKFCLHFSIEEQEGKSYHLYLFRLQVNGSKAM